MLQITQSIANYLNRAMDICKEIGWKTRIERIGKEAKEKDERPIKKETTPIVILADRTRIIQMLSNLLDNMPSSLHIQ